VVRFVEWRREHPDAAAAGADLQTQWLAFIKATSNNVRPARAR
jgi:hypothetical protein